MIIEILIKILAFIGAVFIWIGLYKLNKSLGYEYEDEEIFLIFAPLFTILIIFDYIGWFLLRFFTMPKRIEKLEKELKNIQKNMKGKNMKGGGKKWRGK